MLAAVGLGLHAGLSSDGNNRFWEGKAFGGSITIIGLVVYLIGAAAVKTYKKNKSIKEVGSAFKNGFLEIISINYRKVDMKRKSSK